MSSAMRSEGDSETPKGSRPPSRHQPQPQPRTEAPPRPESQEKKEPAVTVGDIGIHGPLLMLAAQVDSMRPLPVPKPTEPSTEVTDANRAGRATNSSPQVYKEAETPPHMLPMSPHHKPPAPKPPAAAAAATQELKPAEPKQPPLQQAPARFEGHGEGAAHRRLEVERYPAQRIATIRPITQPPRMVKMPGLVPYPQKQHSQAPTEDPKQATLPQKMEKTYRDMLYREIQKVYAQEFPKSEPAATATANPVTRVQLSEVQTTAPPLELLVRAPPPGGAPPSAQSGLTGRERATVGSLLGDHSPNDILYLRCNLCASTYGSLHSFRKHFSKAHGHDPSAVDITIQTISATKDAIDKAKGVIHEPPAQQEAQRYQEMALEKQQALQHLNLLPSNQYYESQLSRYKTGRGGLPEHMTEGAVASARMSPCYPREAYRGSPPISSPHYPPRSEPGGKHGVEHRGSPPAVVDRTSPLCSPSDKDRDAIPVMVSDKTMLKCPQCYQEFSTRDWGVFRRHVRAHEAAGEGLNKCEVCRETFHDEQDWQQHLALTHTSQSSHLECRVCGAGFQHPDTLAHHLQTAHAAASREPEHDFRCRLCSKSFVHESGLIVHMQEHADLERSKEAHESKLSPTAVPPPVSSHSYTPLPARSVEHKVEPRSGGAAPTSVSTGVATMYARRMSFSEAMHRDFKHPAASRSMEDQEHIKRPRSGSFPNALDFLEKKVEDEHRRLLVANAKPDSSLSHRVLKLPPPGGRPATVSEQMRAQLEQEQKQAMKRMSQDVDAGVERKRLRAGPPHEGGEHIPEKLHAQQQQQQQQQQQPTTRSLIDEMVETAVSELAAAPYVNSSPPLKILPRLFKGDPMEKVWDNRESQSRSHDVKGHSESGKPTVSATSASDAPSHSGEHALQKSSGRAPEQEKSHQVPAKESSSQSEQRASVENIVRHTMLTMPYFVAKKPENVRDIIESLVTMEISANDALGERKQNVEGLRPKAEPVSSDESHESSLPRSMASLATPNPVSAAPSGLGERLGKYLQVQLQQNESKESAAPGHKTETFRETISQAFEKSIGCELLPEETSGSSRLRQLMTEKPVFCGDRSAVGSDHFARSASAAMKPAQRQEDNTTSKDSKSQHQHKDGSGLQSMREICDQIIAKSLSNFEQNNAPAVNPKPHDSHLRFRSSGSVCEPGEVRVSSRETVPKSCEADAKDTVQHGSQAETRSSRSPGEKASVTDTSASDNTRADTHAQKQSVRQEPEPRSNPTHSPAPVSSSSQPSSSASAAGSTAVHSIVTTASQPHPMADSHNRGLPAQSYHVPSFTSVSKSGESSVRSPPSKSVAEASPQPSAESTPSDSDPGKVNNRSSTTPELAEASEKRTSSSEESTNKHQT